MRPPVDTIVAPSFPKDLAWVNVAPLRMEKQATRPVLIEFWDFCRPSSLRTLPYVKAWHERYADAGLRVISVHAPGFPPGHDEHQVRAAVERLGIEHPVAIDTDFLLWRAYANPGWPARYLFAPRLKLVDVHHGEGDYHGTERVIQELLGVDGDLVELVRPSDDDDAPIVVPTAEREGAYSGPYEAGEVWVVTGGQRNAARQRPRRRARPSRCPPADPARASRGRRARARAGPGPRGLRDLVRARARTVGAVRGRWNVV